MRNVCLATLFLFTPAIAQEVKPSAPAPIQKAKVASSRDFVPVADDVKVLKEETLPFDAPMNANPTSGIDASGASSNLSEAVRGPEGATVAMDSYSASVQDANESGKKGLRLYSFTLKPNERIYFRTKGYPAGKIVMSFALPQKIDAMFEKMKSTNKIQLSTQSSRLELKNVLPEPYTFVLRLGGSTGYPYTLEIERK